MGSGLGSGYRGGSGGRAGSRSRSSDRRGNRDIWGSRYYTSTPIGHLLRLPSLRISGLRAAGLWISGLLGIPRLLRSSGLWIPRLFGIPRLPRLTGLRIPEPPALLSLLQFRLWLCLVWLSRRSRFGGLVAWGRVRYRAIGLSFGLRFNLNLRRRSSVVTANACVKNRIARRKNERHSRATAIPVYRLSPCGLTDGPVQDR